ncbi:hypothetical protein [Pseudonocardia adelaidensis]|uniref:hypothetical protein n=1 Tax=Pseudonocardia adelaidensis TaxID=648754 RepID=UPI0031F0888B
MIRNDGITADLVTNEHLFDGAWTTRLTKSSLDKPAVGETHQIIVHREDSFRGHGVMVPPPCCADPDSWDGRVRTTTPSWWSEGICPHLIVRMTCLHTPPKRSTR